MGCRGNYFFLLCTASSFVISFGSPLYWKPEPGSTSKILRSEYDTTKRGTQQDIVNKIILTSLHGSGKHQSYDRLATFTDKFGNRIAGSDNLEKSIDYLLAEMEKEGLENVHGEVVEINPWIRNTESLKMITPKVQDMALLGLGKSVPTPTGGIQAEILVVRTFDELKSKAAEAKGKIVVFNEDYKGYGESVVYRVSGASKAAEVGAVAALVRSVASLSIYSPHTGTTHYDTDNKIPTACITIEDAEMLQRMQERGEKITLQLEMNCETGEPKPSRNVIAEITGSTNPQEVVLFGGHIDSWDVGKGAMDDGGGAFISWQVLSLVKQLGFRPKRTLRMIMWTGEEYGGVGGQAYYEAHKHEVQNFKFVMESDRGTFKPTGFVYWGDKQTAQIVKNISQLLKPINSTTFQISDTAGNIGEDVTPWIQAGVPGASLLNHNENYFYYHHSQGDTMTVQDPVEMDQCSAAWTSLAYLMADL